MGNPILEIKNLNKVYHDLSGEILAIDSLSLAVKEKEFIAIVGPSGCGKSTLLSILAGLEKKSGGSIKLHDDCKLGYMLQDDSLFPWLTILDNCLLGLQIKKKMDNQSKEQVIRLLKTYGLEEFMDKYPKSLSGGMRQRVALIRTLAINPDILLLDEPFSALDYQTRLALSDDVYNIIKKEGKTTLMVTHDLAEAISMADKVVILSKRPCRVKKIIDIDLSNRLNPIQNRKAKEFNYYYDLLWKEIDYHV